MCGKFHKLHGCDTDQEIQDTVRDVSSEQANECRVLTNPSGQCNDL